MEWEGRSWVSKGVAIAEFPFTVLRVATHPKVGRNNVVRLVVVSVCSPLCILLLTHSWGSEVAGGFVAWHVGLIVGVVVVAPVAVAVNSAAVREKVGHVDAVFAVWEVSMAVIWMNAIANELVATIQMLGHLLSISNGVMSATILSWGDALGDVVANIGIARAGRPTMAVSACYSGPLLNTLLGIGISSVAIFVRQGRGKKGGGAIPVSFSGDKIVLVASIFGSVACSVVCGAVRRRQFERWLGLVLIGCYVVFAVFVVLVEVGVIK
ncbi:Ca2+:Cation Antiporter (CaCA) Family Protein [Monocercomonoides exilis]|uniref:Ca2+:Cation Antiporter (CaCA) Family Protein n=1 Tax=Monocercomonoides exilis TaxID=2049356 RepID=UPI00355A8157|nr:Ca2+:Cation Antiporter (CaCA) Family Protein [Monocercomonoides exilis]|eukprot:MONOS_10740.1-p1 / transcript=MONOS_10740.1 / gene=MONOS_10740 / organism=Monocercomonoides_exilis_PA203 / gene_product=Ca2+:Cation Antiporter (CaCA) Family Protein / transcript_product=Ca2+:Cation Antiporter (CaCA) Family Protein / location=Mono_scaffold00500:5133-5933(+) / protein_length=267 / sequence_SO=supercontig / SO=protein_coding / is_pseudo=false